MGSLCFEEDNLRDSAADDERDGEVHGVVAEMMMMMRWWEWEWDDDEIMMRWWWDDEMIWDEEDENKWLMIDEERIRDERYARWDEMRMRMRLD